MADTRLVIGLAVLPAVILLFYTYLQDRLQREPVGQVIKAFFVGWLSVFSHSGGHAEDAVKCFFICNLMVVRKISAVFDEIVFCHGIWY